MQQFIFIPRHAARTPRKCSCKLVCCLFAHPSHYEFHCAYLIRCESFKYNYSASTVYPSAIRHICIYDTSIRTYEDVYTYVIFYSYWLIASSTLRFYYSTLSKRLKFLAPMIVLLWARLWAYVFFCLSTYTLTYFNVTCNNHSAAGQFVLCNQINVLFINIQIINVFCTMLSSFTLSYSFISYVYV